MIGAKQERRAVIRKRKMTYESANYPVRVRIGVTPQVNNALASIQGLCYAHGERETLSELFECVMMPALRAYVRPYAEAAEREHLAANAARAED